MAETPDLFAEVAAMRNQLDDVSAMTAALLRSSAGATKQILDRMKKDKVARYVYLLSDGKNTQAEIVTILTELGVKGGSRSGVSRKIEVLTEDFHLLAPDHRTSKGSVHRKTEIARALHVDRELKNLGLDQVE